MVLNWDKMACTCMSNKGGSIVNFEIMMGSDLLIIITE